MSDEDLVAATRERADELMRDGIEGESAKWLADEFRTLASAIEKARIEGAEAMREQFDTWADQVVIALNDATEIGKRSCRDGDHLHYAHHGWLVAARPTLVAIKDPVKDQ